MNNIGWVPHLGLRSVRFCRNQCLQKRNAGCDDEHKSAVPRQILRCYSERWDSNILWHIYFTFIVNPLLQEFTHHRPNGMSQRKKSQVHSCLYALARSHFDLSLCLLGPTRENHPLQLQTLVNCSWWTFSPVDLVFFFFSQSAIFRSVWERHGHCSSACRCSINCSCYPE